MFNGRHINREDLEMIDKKWYRYIDIYDVTPDERNSKDHDVGVLCESMIRFGFTQPILVNKSDNKLLAGHGRVKALQSLLENGYQAPKRIMVEKDIEDEKIEHWLVPYHEVNIEDKAEAEAYLIADNRLTEIGGWLDDKLVASLHNILDETGTLDGTGWDLEDLDDIVKELDKPLVDDDEVTIKVGKYKVKVSKEAFDSWLIKVQSEVGKDKEDIEDLITQRLEIERL